MRTLTLFTTFILFTLFSFGQYGYYYDFDVFSGNSINYNQYSQKIKELNRINKISGKIMLFENVKKHKTAVKYYEYRYNTVGNTTKYSMFTDDGKLVQTYEYEYDNQNRSIKESYYNKKSKLIYTFENIYKEGNKLPDKMRKNAKGEIEWKTEYRYTNNNISEYIYYKKGKIKSRYVYDYYDSLNLKTIKVFDSKGKLTKVWSYECKKEGEVVQKAKDTTRVCKLIDYDNQGYKTITHISTDEKGKTSRSVSKYFQDTILVSTKSFDSKEFLTYEFSSDYGKDTITQITKRYKKGIVRSITEGKMNSDGMYYSSTYINKGKTKYSNLYFYNEMKLLSEIHHYDKNNQLEYKRKFEFTHF